MKRTILYHNDLDGIASAAIMWRALGGDESAEETIDCIPVNYHQPFPADAIQEGQQVYILDYSLPVEDMEVLLTKIKFDCGEDDRKVVWIDHHKSSIEGYPDLPGKRDTSKAACELVWEYCHPKLDIPRGIKYVGDRDTWKWAYGDETKYFYNGMQLIFDVNNPKSVTWDMIIDDEGGFLSRLMREGEVIENYKINENEKLVKTWAYEVEFEGYICLALNASNTIDRLSNTMLKREYPIAILWTFNGETYTVSFYTTKEDIDLSEIAKIYCGGGHRKSAGCVVRALPFTKKK